MSLGTKLTGAVLALVAMTGAASAGVVAVVVPEPMTMALFGASVGALYLIKKLRG